MRRRTGSLGLVKATAKLADPFRPLPVSGPQPILIRNAAGQVAANPNLTDDCCRWPVEHRGETRFCALTTTPGRSYCDRHYAIVYPRPAYCQAVSPAAPQLQARTPSCAPASAAVPKSPPHPRDGGATSSERRACVQSRLGGRV